VLKVCPRCGFQTKEPVCPRCGHHIDAVGTIVEVAASAISQVSCKVVGHKWEGCKCTRCGATRDEGHKFKPVEGKCEQKCTICGIVKPLPHQWEGDKCTRCGASKGSFVKLFGIVKQNPLPSLIVVGIIIAGIISISFLAAAVQETREVLTPGKPETQIGIIIDYDKNLLFNKYEIRVSVDDVVLGTMPQGEKGLFYIVLTQETHTITISEVGNDTNKTSKEFVVLADNYYYFLLKAESGGITIKSTDIMNASEANSFLGK
jgi:hypothetical protein